MTTFNTPKTIATRSASVVVNRLQRTAVWLVLLIVCSLMWQASLAAAHDKNESATLSVLKFAGGFISSYAFHEAGHAVAAAATGTELDWGLGTYNQPLGFTEHAESDTAGFLVHSSGLATQVVVSEIILQTDAIDKNDSFVRGIMWWNILNPLIYALDYWVIRSTNKEEDDFYQGDIQGVAHYSDDATAEVFAFGVSALATYQAYRFFKTQDWAPQWMKNDSVRLNFASQGRDGAMLKIEIDF